MNKIIKLILLLSVIVLSGCIAYPSISPIYGFRGKVVYKNNEIEPNGTKHFKGETLPYIPVYIYYTIFDESNGLFGSRWRCEPRGTYGYYTFTDKNGNFSIPFLWRPYWRIQGIYNWTTVSSVNIEFITDTTSWEMISTLPCQYRNSDSFSGDDQKFLLSNPSPLHWGDSNKLNEFIQKVNLKKKQQNSQTK